MTLTNCLRKKAVRGLAPATGSTPDRERPQGAPSERLRAHLTRIDLPTESVRAELFVDPASGHFRFAIFGETGHALVSSTGFKGRDEAWSTLLKATAGTRGLVIHDRTTGLTHVTP